ncbi:MAG: hypothetical protein C0390_03995 [Syntrophus sp. (in: bacteria)]|nr:hypothetical protein [Syntrophus sp. (in: bacteria)]
MKKTVLLIITLDTKGTEAHFLKSVLERQGIDVLVMNTGMFPSPSGEGDISRQEVALAGGRSIEQLLDARDRGEVIETMMNGAAILTKSLYDRRKIHAVLSIGGAQGTLIGTTAMRVLPIGVPKVMLSTMASGKRPFETYVGTTDITLIHSVVDFFGLNPILKQILTHAAGAVAGMIRAGTVRTGKRAQIAITIYGTTTPTGMRIVSLLKKAGYDIVAFHPNGVGGKAMEQMIRQGMFTGIIDLTTHELIDELAGGEHTAGPDRMEAASAIGIPQVIIPGSTDYIVAGSFTELKKIFKKRKTIMHNPEMTFVQPSNREMARLGQTMARKLNHSHGNTVVIVPLRGFSHPNQQGRAFYNPSGVRAFVKGLQEKVKSSIPVKLLPMHINDEPFAAAVVDEFQNLVKKTSLKSIQQKGDKICHSKERSSTSARRYTRICPSTRVI